jgi:alpha-mannosidase
MTRKCLFILSCSLSLAICFGVAQSTAAEKGELQQPARKWVVYLLPHSHVDIGYTHRQAEVEQKQWRNIDTALALCAKTAAFPHEARFKWNVEVLWAVDSYLRQATPERRRQFIDAVRAGQVGLDALYGNELTGLCRPEELLRLLQWGAEIGRQCGVKVDSAMISDVPGLTWGTVPAFAQAGVKYISLGLNLGDSGRAIAAWEDKPFYWLGPDGRQRILCWLPYKGYALGHPSIGFKLEQGLPKHLAELEKQGYPYDIAQIRWNVGGDNGPPDVTLPDVVKQWNAKHDYPRMVIATTSEIFREFEKRYAGKIPVVSGDFTPYWENGACSSARETAVNRTAAERLVQAELLSAMLNPRQYPAGQFTEAWRNVILYDEHTWGAFNSITEPDLPFVKDQWKVKQAFALNGDLQSRKLLTAALDGRGAPATGSVDVFNTSSWPRTDLVVLGKEFGAAGYIVTDPDGKTVPSQRLSTGELVFLAHDVPALAARRYAIGDNTYMTMCQVNAEGDLLTAPTVSVRVDPASGAIKSLRSKAVDAELCDLRSGVGLNRYCYVLGNRVKEAQQAGPAKVTVKESGPLVASLLIESAAPGCTNLRREIRVVDGLDRVDIIDVIDKKAVREKEGVHLGFAFNVPDGVMRMDVPWAIMRPEIDQINGSCKNWFSVGHWVDVSNREYGVTWATLDAPMVEVGAITATKMGNPGINPADWLAKLVPSQTLYSMVMNNHWDTNYKADQDGPTTFRYSILPHKKYDAGAAQRFGIECSQPLVAAPARGAAPTGRPFLELDTPEVLVASIKPSNDHKAWIVRLFGAAGKEAKATVRWGTAQPKAVWISNLAEDQCTAATGAIDVPAFGIVTLRADIRND